MGKGETPPGLGVEAGVEAGKRDTSKSIWLVSGREKWDTAGMAQAITNPWTG